MHHSRRPLAPASAGSIFNPDAMGLVFISDRADDRTSRCPMSVRAMKAGAGRLPAKAVRDQDMIDAVTAAIERDRNGAPPTAPQPTSATATPALAARAAVMTMVTPAR